MLRKLIVSVVTCVTLGVVASPVSADNGAEKVNYPVSFTVSWENCSQLPDGIVVTGSGTFTDIFTKSGNESQGHGTATDNLGNTYVWHYASHLTAHNSNFIDHFNLSGNGPAAYVTAFRAIFEGADILPVWAHGDPFAFPNGGGRCDPL